MESALANTHRTIEYPADLSECSSLVFENRQLLYICSSKEGKLPFTVVLGFFLEQKEDFVTKDLIEPIAESKRSEVEQAVKSSLPSVSLASHIFFL